MVDSEHFHRLVIRSSGAFPCCNLFFRVFRYHYFPGCCNDLKLGLSSIVKLTGLDIARAGPIHQSMLESL